MTPEALTADLLGNGPFARDDAPFRLLELRGPDAGDFLQRLCSQDVLRLAPGAAAPAAFLDSKGKLLATCLVARVAESFWLEVPAEQEERLAALLDRYHFTEKLTIARHPELRCREVVATLPPRDGIARPVVGQGLMLEIQRLGVGFQRTHAAALDDAGTSAPLSPELADCLRLLAGFVRVGVETEPATLLLETGLDDHCSTTKGCYTGQEIVARIHTYGHVNRRLCLLELPAGPAITGPLPLHDDDDLAVGRVLHAVPLPGREVRLGVGYLPKDFQAPGTVLKFADGGRATVLR
jgi:folate-binding protein YgfZ